MGHLSARRYGGDASAGDGGDGVDRGHHGAHGAVVLQGLADARYDGLRHERAGGVVEEQVHRAAAAGRDGREARVAALGAAGYDGLHFGPGPQAGLVPQGVVIFLGGHDDDFVDAGGAAEGFDGVFYHHASAQGEVLLGPFGAEAAAASAGEHHGHVGALVYDVCHIMQRYVFFLKEPACFGQSTYPCAEKHLPVCEIQVMLFGTRVSAFRGP